MINFRRKRAAIFTFSLEKELDECRKICEEKNYQIVDIFSNFDDFLETSKDGLYDVLILHSLESLEKKTGKILEIVDELTKSEIKIVLCQTNDLIISSYVAVSNLKLRTIKNKRKNEQIKVS